MIEIRKFKNAREFLVKCETFLIRDETKYNLILGLADAMATGARTGNAEIYLGIYEDGVLKGVCLRTDNERPLSLTEMDEKYLKKLATFIHKNKIILAGVIGPNDIAEKFGCFYIEDESIKLRLSMHQGIYELNNLIIPQSQNCDLSLAKKEDMYIVTKLISGFLRDCFPELVDSSKEVETMVNRHLRNKTLYLLRTTDGDVVAMAANNRNTKNSACVSLVYTFNEFRGRGYGSLVTALVSESMLAGGKLFCNLFTDLKNPTSNSIYKKIGYKMIGESKHYDFLKVNFKG